MKFPQTPELIATIEEITNDGDSNPIGDKIIGISVFQEKGNKDGRIDIDIRDFDKKRGNIVIRIQLPELMAAISCATLNADREE